MCYSYYETSERADGQVDILAWRDPLDRGNNHALNDAPLWPIATVKDSTTASRLIEILNASVKVQTVKEYDDNGDPVHHTPYDNGFWNRPSPLPTELDPCTGLARVA
jgi:hypothetical protein